MGFIRRISQHGADIKAAQGESSDRVLTLANLMTASRPLLAVYAGRKMLGGEKGVAPAFILMGLSDSEGHVARFGDRLAPGSFIGTSTIGAEFDPIADTAAMLVYSLAALKAPRLNKVSKTAIAVTLAQEAVKTGWALAKNHEYHQITGERLHIPSSVDGKVSITEKVFALGFASLLNEVDNPYLRGVFSLVALGLAVDGVRRAEDARAEYSEQAIQLIAQAMPWTS